MQHSHNAENLQQKFSGRVNDGRFKTDQPIKGRTGYHDSLNWLKIMVKQWLKASTIINSCTDWKNRVLLHPNLRLWTSKSRLPWQKQESDPLENTSS